MGIALMVKPVDEHSRIDLAGGTERGINLLLFYRVSSFSFEAGYGMMHCLARLYERLCWKFRGETKHGTGCFFAMGLI